MSNPSANAKQVSYKTAVIGFGQMAAGLSDSVKAARFYPLFTHAQILDNHDGYDWVSVIDIDAQARDIARTRWGIQDTADCVGGLRYAADIEVAVLATPPHQRLAFVEALPNLKAVVTEKPLGANLEDATAFLEYCRARNIQVQVNFPRRADDRFRDLAMGGLAERVGEVQAVFGVYGNGLRNNGTHMVDVCRALFGDVVAVQALNRHADHAGLPIANDVAVDFMLFMASGHDVIFRALDFKQYRENGLDIWGTKGRLSILQEMTDFRYFGLSDCRILDEFKEIQSDGGGQRIFDEHSMAYRNIYDNLLQALQSDAPLCSPGESAQVNEIIIDAIITSLEAGGSKIAMSPAP